MRTLALALSDTGALAARHVRHLTRAPGKLIAMILNPLIMLIAVGYVFKSSIVVPGSGVYEEYIMAGIAAQAGLTLIGPTAIGVALDVRGGLIDRFRSLPISRLTVLTGHTLSDLMLGMICLTVLTAVGAAMGWRFHDGVLPALGAFALLLAFFYAMIWVGVVIGLTMRNIEAIESMSAIVMVGLSFLSNAFLSIQGLPAWLRPIAEWNPVSAIATTCRELWGNAAITSSTFPGRHPGLVVVLTLCLVMAVAVPLSLRAYRADRTR
ncbi:ABC transporter permease [Nonomuraea sp. B12E4]|uniref:ABC transporter permease n=1 Tax=Nonomuraea sp. B12E4 TaxID=3153564 RepID=UPI00325F36E9